MRKVGRSWEWSCAELSSESSQKGVWQVRSDAQLFRLGGGYLTDCSGVWIKSALSFLFPFPCWLWFGFFSCYPPLFLVAGWVSRVQAFTAGKMLLARSPLGILVKVDLRKGCAKALVPCLNSSTHLPPVTACSQTGLDSQKVFPKRLLSSLLFAYSCCFPDKVHACAFWPSSCFPLKCSGLQKLGFGGECPPLSSNPVTMNGLENTLVLPLFQ